MVNCHVYLVVAAILELVESFKILLKLCPLLTKFSWIDLQTMPHKRYQRIFWFSELFVRHPQTNLAANPSIRMCDNISAVLRCFETKHGVSSQSQCLKISTNFCLIRSLGDSVISEIIFLLIQDCQNLSLFLYRQQKTVAILYANNMIPYYL